MARWAVEPPVDVEGPQADPEQVARTILLRRLEAAPRTRAQLATTLRERGVADEVSQRVLDRFEEVGLIDDRLFARMWVDSRQASRKLSARALRDELRSRGVAEDLIREAVASVSPDDELEAAREVAERRARGLQGLPRPTQVRRLTGALARRGYGPGVAAQVVHEVLAELDGESAGDGPDAPVDTGDADDLAHRVERVPWAGPRALRPADRTRRAPAADWAPTRRSTYPWDAMSQTIADSRTYQVRTFGCQMNVHDSERIAGLLEAHGYVRAQEAAGADVVVLNTCAVRENADNKLYGNLGHLASAKRARPGMQIAVGGCLAQKDRDGIIERAPWVDVVFGTHNVGSLPALLRRAAVAQQAQVEIEESLRTFPSTLPSRRESAYAAWVAISVGCNNTCTFCIVPQLRGRERDRRPGEVLGEVTALVAEGVIEVTLLGQNVNAYGAEFGDRGAFAELLRACGRVDGLERVRFTSPHPRDFTDDVIDAMAQTPAVMPSLHMPLQSGSDRILRAMRRSYRRDRFLGILQSVRRRIPDAAITTDIIVGFPGETEEDFAATLDLVEQARFAAAFTFQYSPRPGTPAAEMTDQVPKAVVQERYDRLVTALERISWEENLRLVGDRAEVLVSEGEGRKDERTRRLSGRARDGRLVHFSGAGHARPGDCVTVRIESAAPHHLTGVAQSVRRTRAGDAWETGQAACGTPAGTPAGAAAVPAGPVGLGMPTLRVGA